MVLLTVIGKTLAKPGQEFIFMGPNSNCRECKVKTICFHLEQGSKYKITGTREVVHQCPQHDDGVVVVQVEEVPRQAVIPKRRAMEGTTITLELPNCRNRGCPRYSLCFPIGMETGMKKKVIEARNKVDCALGQERVEVVLE